MTQLRIVENYAPVSEPLNRAGPAGAGTAVRAERAGSFPALGTQYSIGKTIARVLLAIVTVGFSELVAFIIRKVCAMAAPAEPHLPQNQELPRISIMQANTILAGNYRRNDLATRALVEQGRGKALSVLGDIVSLDTAALTEKLARAILNSDEEVSNVALENLAERATRDVLMESIAMAAFEASPDKGVIDTNDKKISFLKNLCRSDEGQALLEAPNAETATRQLAKVKDRACEILRGLADYAAVKQELCKSGLQFFCVKTGVTEEQAASLPLNALDGKLFSIKQLLDSDVATPERPYTRASKSSLRSAFTENVKSFFEDRALAYNSIAVLDVPDSLKIQWRDTCLKSREKIQHDLFSKTASIGLTLATFPQVKDLSHSSMTVDQKLNGLGEIVKNYRSQVVNAFEAERLKKMGPDDTAMLMILVIEAMVSVMPETITSLSKTPELVIALQENMEQRQLQLNPLKNREQYDSVTGACQILLLILGHLK